MFTWNDFKITVSIEDILRGQGADPEKILGRKPAIARAAERALAEGSRSIQPAAHINEVEVVKHGHERIELKGGGRLTGPKVTSHLAGARQITAAVCTIGAALEEQGNQLFDADPILALAYDGLANAAVEILGQQVCRRIGENAQTKGFTASTPLSPGEPDWPVEVGQPQVFSLVNAERTGIHITSGGMMIPKKSISFVVGIGPDMTQVEPCEVCGLRESCRYRHG